MTVTASPYLSHGQAFLLSEQFRANFPGAAAAMAPRCSCAGGSPRAEPDSRPHEPQCELSTLTADERRNYIADRALDHQMPSRLRRHRERNGLLEGGVAQILMSPTDTPRPTGLAAWLPERGILDKDGNDPNAQQFRLPVQIVDEAHRIGPRDNRVAAIGREIDATMSSIAAQVRRRPLVVQNVSLSEEQRAALERGTYGSGFIGVDWGAQEDTAAVVVGHTTEDGKLVIDSETIVK